MLKYIIDKHIIDSVIAEIYKFKIIQTLLRWKQYLVLKHCLYLRNTLDRTATIQLITFAFTKIIM
jgi:hypothetical protein